MNAVYVQRGESIDYTPTANIAAGDVVIIGEIVGIAKLDIPANELGAIAVTGVYDMVKATGEISAGATVYWDATAKNVTTTASENTAIGKAVAAAESSATIVRVLLNA